LLSGCAHDKARVVRRLADPESISLPACPTAFPAIPDEAARRGIYGVVLVGYVVEPTGRVDQIELEDRRASPLLFEAVKEWLDQCRGAEQERSPRRFSELFSFRPPSTTAAPSETMEPVDEKSPGVTPPARSSSCLPDRPPPLLPVHGTLTVKYVVHSDGRVGNVVRTGGDSGVAQLLKSVRIWLESCPYTPGMQEGRAIPVKVAQSFTFSAE